MKPNTPTSNPPPPDAGRDPAQKLADTLIAVHNLAQELTLTRDETQIARAVVQAARQVLRFRLCTLLLVRENELDILASVGYGKSLQDFHLSLDGQRGVTVAAVRSGEPLYVPDVSQDPRYVAGGPFQIRSEFAVPLKSGQRVLGVLNIESERLDAFDTTDRQQLVLLADVAAVALENAHAYQAEGRRATEMTALYDLAVTLAAERDPAAIVSHVFDTLNELRQVKMVTLSLFDPTTGKLTEHGVDRGERLPPHSPPLDDASLPVRVMQNKGPLRLDNLHTSPRPGPDIQVGARPHAWLGVPLWTADRINGCLGVQSYRPYAFGPDEERLLTQIAALVAPLLESTRSFDQTRRRLAREKRLTELSHTLSGETKLAALMPRLLPPVVELTGADAGSVAVLEPSRQIITHPFHHNMPDTLTELEVPAGKGLAGQAMTVRRPVLVDDYQMHHAALPAWINAGVRSSLSVPLIVGDEVVGALGLFSLNEVRPFDSEAIAAAQAAARPAAIAIQRARLFGAERQRWRETEALRRASLALSATLDADQVLDVLLDQINWVIPYDAANVMVIEGETVCVTHLRGFWQADAVQEIMALRFSLHQTHNLHRMFTTRRPHIVPNTHADPNWIRLPATEPIHSWAGAPIILRDEGVIGFFSLDSKTPDFYTPEQAELLTAFAAHAAVAIENARLYQAVREHATQLEEQVHERTAELQAERDRTQAILDSAAEGVIVTDLEGIIQYVNPAIERLTGYSAAAILGQGPDVWQSRSQSDPRFQHMWQTILAGQTWKGEMLNKRQDGTFYEAQVTIAPIPGPDGDPVGFVGIQSDITHLKELDRMKNQFVSNVSHELRTPLANLKLYLDLLTRGRAEKREQYLDTMRREADRLEKLIED
ncbi:MAG: GAF domain-containing protein, partial [Anaerolineae bacterium]